MDYLQTVSVQVKEVIESLNEIFKAWNCTSKFEYSKTLVLWKDIWEAWNI